MSETMTKTCPTAAIESKPVLPDAGDLMGVVAHFQSPLLRYVGGLLGQVNHDAEDIVQDSFVRLHRQIQRKGKESIQDLTAWLFRVAHNRTLDLLRQRAGRKPAEEGLAQSAAEAADQASQEFGALTEVLRDEARQVALRELSALPAELRQVVLLKIIQGMTFRQIAGILKISTSAVNYRLGQGLEELSRRLKRAGVV